MPQSQLLSWRIMGCHSAGPRMARSTRGHLGDRVMTTGEEDRHTGVAVSATEQVLHQSSLILHFILLINLSALLLQW